MYNKIYNESSNYGGIEYEKKVWNSLKEAEKFVPGLEVLGNEPSGGFDSHSPDIVFNYNNKETFIEVKKDSGAQTGGLSTRYIQSSKEFFLTKNIDDEDLENVIFQTLQLKVDDIDTLLNFLKNQEPINFHSKIKGFPLIVEKNAWTEAQKNGLLIPLNIKITNDASFVINHYARKGVNYIQIGGSGLFYLKTNPLKLPVPQLSGVVNIEMRSGRSGSKDIKYNEGVLKVASGLIRIQGRLKFKSVSPYTLDDVQSIVELFS